MVLKNKSKFIFKVARFFASVVSWEITWPLAEVIKKGGGRGIFARLTDACKLAIKEPQRAEESNRAVEII